MGNGRVFFSDMDKNGIVEVAQNGNANELLQQEHYYPFGMGIKGEWKFVQPQIGGTNLYQYNGKELNDDYGLNWNDYGARWYDASIGRWNGVDPLAEDYNSWSGYNYVLGNPLKYIDPDGRVVLPILWAAAVAITRVAIQNAPRIYRAYKAYESTKAMVSTVQTIVVAEPIKTVDYTYSEVTVTVGEKGVKTGPEGFTTHQGVVGVPSGVQAAAESGMIPSIDGVAIFDPSIWGTPSAAQENLGDAIMWNDDDDLEGKLREVNEGLNKIWEIYEGQNKEMDALEDKFDTAPGYIDPRDKEKALNDLEEKHMEQNQVWDQVMEFQLKLKEQLENKINKR